MSKYKYNFFLEIETYRDGNQYSGIDTYGNTLEECFDNATTSVIDQDGGDHGPYAADSRWMQELIEEEVKRLDGWMCVEEAKK